MKNNRIIKLAEGQELFDINGNKYITEKDDTIQEQRATSIFSLVDPDLVDKLVQFIRLNPFPLDEDYHKFAEENGIEPDVVEQYAYAMLSVILCGGKSKGMEILAGDDNKFIGNFIEQEHVIFDDERDSDEVIKKIQDVFICKILSDHLVEDKNYYVNVKDFVAELEKEQGE